MANRPSRLYHVTYPDRLEQILREGLLVGSERLFSGENGWADEVYGDRPIYLSYEPWISCAGRTEMVLLSVNVKGLTLVSDLCSLTDWGAYLEEGLGLWWENGELPGDLAPYMDSAGEYVPFEALLGEAAEAAIELTRPAAYLRSIPPSRIRQVEKWPEPKAFRERFAVPAGRVIVGG